MYQIQLINHAVFYERRLEIETDRQNNRRLRFSQENESDYFSVLNNKTNILRKFIRQFIVKRPYCSYAHDCNYKILEG